MSSLVYSTAFMLTDKQKKIFKLIILLAAAIALTCGAEYMIEFFMHSDKSEFSFFASHLSLGLALMFMGVVAFLLPFTTRTRFGDGKGDNMMLIVGILLALSGIITIGLSFVL